MRSTSHSLTGSSSNCPHVFQRTQLCLAISAMLVPVWLFAAPVVGPNGGVASGSANIVQNGAVTDINQSSNKAVINWQSFSTSPNETVNFNQPNAASITLNRVVGNEQSVLQGALNATGKVFLVNPNGVLISTGATVNTGGFLASTLNITDEDFNKGNYTFKGNGSTAAITNLGTITVTDGGYVVLMGHLVSNQGAIVATKGAVSLNAGNKVTLNFNGNSLLSVTIDEGALNALVENKQAIYADGGQVILTAKAADDLLGSQVNNTGIVQAQTIDDLKGTIEIYAHGGTANVSGKLDASAPVSGDGGFIETSGDKVKIADSAVITTKSTAGKSGTWLIDPTDFTIAASGGDITGAALSTQLANNALVTIEAATMGASGVNGDINVNDRVSWSTDSTLELIAVRDININNEIKASGANAGLVMNYGRDYNIRTKASYSGTVLDANGKSVAKLDTSGGVYGKITLSGAASTLHINNQEYTLVHSMAELAAKINSNVNPNGLYALAQDIDAAGTEYTGAVVETLNGTLAGLGNTFNNLTINAPTVATLGLIAQTGPGSVIRDLGVVNAAVSGKTDVGILAGKNFGNLSNVYTTGSVTGTSKVGGLVGSNVLAFNPDGSAVQVSFTDVYSDVRVTGSQAGGLVGWTRDIVVTRAHAKGDVSQPGDTGTGIGGLIGFASTASVTDSYATGKVSAGNKSDSVGGLIGSIGDGTGAMIGKIVNSFATGDVIGGRNIGGLVGNLLGYYGFSVQNSYATGKVTGTTPTNVTTSNGVGGLIGYATVGANSGSAITITDSYATGDVSANGYNGHAGGLIGYIYNGWRGNGAITNSYASGNVNGAAQGNSAGGLVGSMTNTSITNSSARGNVSGNKNVGGLVGQASVDNAGVSIIRDSYASGDVSGVTQVDSLIGSATGVTLVNSQWQLSPEKVAEAKVQAIREVQIQGASQQAVGIVQAVQQNVRTQLQKSANSESLPSVNNQIVFADTQNFSADVKSIVVDGVRFNLEENEGDTLKPDSAKDGK